MVSKQETDILIAPLIPEVLSCPVLVILI